MSRYRLNAPSPAWLQAYDRRRAAIHEAGHAVMAAHLGYGAQAWIYRNETGGGLAEKTWLGHVTMRNVPDACDHPHARMIAVSGMVAETLWKDGHVEDYAGPYGLEAYLLDRDSMSESDWRLSNCSPGDPDDELFTLTADVARLFMADLWSSLTSASRTLMRDARANFALTKRPRGVRHTSRAFISATPLPIRAFPHTRHMGSPPTRRGGIYDAQLPPASARAAPVPLEDGGSP